MRYQVKNLADKEVKDVHDEPCPAAVVEALQEAGIVSFGCRPERLDWTVVRKDAESLLARFGRDSTSP